MFLVSGTPIQLAARLALDARWDGLLLRATLPSARRLAVSAFRLPSASLERTPPPVMRMKYANCALRDRIPATLPRHLARLALRFTLHCL
jgi:hypothetical protein